MVNPFFPPGMAPLPQTPAQPSAAVQPFPQGFAAPAFPQGFTAPAPAPAPQAAPANIGGGAAEQLLGALAGQLQNAQISQGGNYPAPGLYRLQLKNAFLHKKNGSNDVLFILEWSILASNVATHPAGGTCSDAIKLADPRCNGPGNTLAVIAALMGLDATRDAAHIASNVSPQLIQYVNAAHAGQLNGREVICEVYEAPKKTKPGEMFNKRRYSPVPAAAV